MRHGSPLSYPFKVERGDLSLAVLDRPWNGDPYLCSLREGGCDLPFSDKEKGFTDTAAGNCLKALKGDANIVPAATLLEEDFAELIWSRFPGSKAGLMDVLQKHFKQASVTFRDCLENEYPSLRGSAASHDE